MKNKYIKRSKISEAKFRQVVKHFALDLTATQTAELTNLNRNTVNRLYSEMRRRISEYSNQHSPITGDFEADESYFGPKRILGKRGRGAAGKTLEFEIVFSRNYAERLDWIQALLTEYYLHFATCKMCDYTDNPISRKSYAETVSKYYLRGLAFGLEMSPETDEKGRCRTMMVWDFNSFRMAVETLYAVSISRTDKTHLECASIAETPFSLLMCGQNFVRIVAAINIMFIGLGKGRRRKRETKTITRMSD